MNTANALWHINDELSNLQTVDLVSDQQLVQLEAKYSLISTGSERLVAMAKVDRALEQHMKVPYMEGSFDLPIKYGYSMIAQTGNGEFMHCMHPHQDSIQLTPQHLFKIPNTSIPAHRLTLISNMETVINAIWDGMPSPNQSIAICGFGNIGSLLATSLRVQMGIEVDVIETNNWRKKRAEKLGWNTQASSEYDLIYHTTATSAGLQFCIDHLRQEGKVVELSWYGDQDTTLRLGHAFHYKRLQLISSQVSSIPISKQKEYDYVSRKQLALEWLKDKSYDELISDFIPFKESPKFFNSLRKGREGDGLIWVIEY